MSGNIFGCDKSGEGARDRSMRQRHHSGEPLVWAQGIGEPVRSAGSLHLGDGLEFAHHPGGFAPAASLLCRAVPFLAGRSSG
jgi:hypothetical protein